MKDNLRGNEFIVAHNYSLQSSKQDSQSGRDITELSTFSATVKSKEKNECMNFVAQPRG